MGAIRKYFIEAENGKVKNLDVMEMSARDAFDAMMEGAALMLDFVGKVEYTYTTKTGNAVHVVMDSP